MQWKLTQAEHAHIWMCLKLEQNEAYVAIWYSLWNQFREDI